MAMRLAARKGHQEDQLEDALVVDETTATYATAFASLCSKLGTTESRSGDEDVALRLAWQMRVAAAAYGRGERLTDPVWIEGRALQH